MLPRLTRLWTHLSKQYGGIRTKGPGETQIETDRRIVRDRISHLKGKLEKIARQRETQRKGRKDVLRVALVGYTNVGKSTLLNILTGSDVLVEDKLFATLDSTVRAVPIGRSTVLFTDTVGFIRKLPTKLVASFKSTLDEVVEADIVLHIVDVSHPMFLEQMDVVFETLRDIKADGKPSITVFNKVDKLEEPGSLAGLKERFPNAIPISAARGMNLGELLSAIQRFAEDRHSIRIFTIRPPDYKIRAEFHREADVKSEEFEEHFIRISCDIPPEMAERMLKSHAGHLEETDAGE
jgi:GTP-binding protein HflX